MAWLIRVDVFLLSFARNPAAVKGKVNRFHEASAVDTKKVKAARRAHSVFIFGEDMEEVF